MKFLTKASLAVIASAGYYLFKTKQTPKQAVDNLKLELDHKKVAFAEFQDARKNLNASLANFKDQMGTVDEVSTQFQRDLDEYMFIVQPHIEEANEYIQKLNH